jgi:hypothetical protein
MATDGIGHFVLVRNHEKQEILYTGTIRARLNNKQFQEQNTKMIVVAERAL